MTPEQKARVSIDALLVAADFIKLRVTTFGVDPEFIEYAMASRVVQDQILDITKGAGAAAGNAGQGVQRQLNFKESFKGNM